MCLRRQPRAVPYDRFSLIRAQREGGICIPLLEDSLADLSKLTVLPDVVAHARFGFGDAFTDTVRNLLDLRGCASVPSCRPWGSGSPTD